VHDLELEVPAGEVVALLGPNGAGKTTTLSTIAGHIQELGGTITLDGEPLRGAAHRRAQRGVAYITEERSVFHRLSTRDNLRLGAGGIQAALQHVPELEPLLGRRAGLLSGGEQQFLALARALAAQPRLLLIDELSLGLAPMIVTRLFDIVRATASQGTAVLIVEQYAHRALEIADSVYVMRRGRIELAGSAAQVQDRLGELRGIYLSTKQPL